MYYLWRKGYYVQRSYASKGVFDILAIPPKIGISNNRPLLIQAKNYKGKVYLAPEERKNLRKASQAYNGHCCICYNEKGKLKWKLVYPYSDENLKTK